MSISMLRVSGTKIVDANGQEVVLRGAGLGGWMNMENFISGFPGCEFQIREALTQAIGVEKAEFYFDKFLEYFFQEEDAVFFASLGLNAIRIPFNYHHFEDDMNPRVLKQEGFRHLDRVIDICARHGIYTILDLHTAPGGQSGGWHADAGTHIANFWIHKDFQDRFVWLWTELAKHYKGNPWIAGYNPLNEPADPSHTRLLEVYDRVHEAIRKEDPEHIIFLDGNTFASDFSRFGNAHEKWENVSYSIHDYSVFGFPVREGEQEYIGSEEQKRRMKRGYEKKREWMDQRGLCVWNGEWGPVYARKEYEGEDADRINEVRYQVLKDQLQIYNQDRLSWSIWLYKDLGFQGMVHLSQNSRHIKLFSSFLQKKHKLAVDSWGADSSQPQIKAVYQPLIDLLHKEVREEDKILYPFPVWRLETRVERIARNMLVGEFLVKEWADHFKGLSLEELEELAKDWSFARCMKREGLNGVLRENAKVVQAI